LHAEGHHQAEPVHPLVEAAAEVIELAAGGGVGLTRVTVHGVGAKVTFEQVPFHAVARPFRHFPEQVLADQVVGEVLPRGT
jgi:hypothetical protein